MARVTPSVGASYDLPEHEPILVHLKECVTGNSKFEEGRRVAELVWEAVDLGGAEGRPRIWETATISVSDGPAGPAKLKRIINAALGRDKSEPVAWVDDEKLTFGLDDSETVAGRIAVGLRLIIRGENEPDKKDPTRKYLRIKSYAPAPSAGNGGVPTAPAPAASRPSPGPPRGRVSSDF